MEYSIQEVARAAGVTSRTLRHYDEIGLVRPSRVGHNGYRFYDDQSLLRLQRVMLLRELGLGLEAIARVLEAQEETPDMASNESETREARILAAHLELLRKEQHRISTQIDSVERTIAALGHAQTNKEGIMNENIFEGFDHTKYREEVEQRWGAAAYAKSDRWWRGLGEQGQHEWRAQVEALNADWVAAARRGEDHASPAAQTLARRHVEWLRSVPHTPASSSSETLSEQAARYVLGLADMYVADDRFAANYGGTEGATFVRDSLRLYISRHRSD